MSTEQSTPIDDLEDDDDESPVLPRSKRPPADAEMDITPMIDCTFLLLIFFTLTFNMGQSVTLPPARSGTTVASKFAIVLVVGYKSADEVEVFLSEAKSKDKLVTGTLAEQDSKIAEYVQKGLQEGGKKEVVVLAEKGIRYKHVDRVLHAVGTALEDEQLVNLAVLEQK